MDFNIFFEDDSKNIGNILHKSDFYEVVYIHQGKCKYWIEGRNYELTPNTFLLIEGGEQRVRVEESKDDVFTRTIIRFKKVWLKEFLETINMTSLLLLFNQNKFGIARVIINKENIDSTHSSFKQIKRLANSKDFTDQMSIKLLLTHLLISFGKCSQLEVRMKADLPFNKKNLIEEVTQFIAQNFWVKITIADIAKELNVSSSYLSHIFKEVMDVSVMKYVMSNRINYAKFKLLDPAKSITQISEECGFETPAHFSRVFKEYVGTTASNYRKKLI